MKYYFSISLTAEEFRPYYLGQVSNIVVTTTQGERLQFPAMHARKFLTHAGVHGHFCMETKKNKFISLTKLSD
jgi:hypothetical protein